MIEIAFIILFAVWGWGGIWAFDALVREQYQSHREEWVLSDSPSGMFFRPPGTREWPGSWRMRKLALAWTFNPPPWARESRTGRLAVFFMRAAFVCALLWLAFVGGFLAWKL
ncbi:MAG TPA: hypothetical protein VEB66_09470 [Opitutaceae bacterium]|nr:hypothetical protein [Opitutaceae bacterium]